jgi:uroporphyrin-3 C-methyltransferase
LQADLTPDPEQSVWQTLLDELKKFIRIRPLSGEEALQPLLAPEESRYLALNLHLAVEQAQLATLKRQQEVYEQSLLNVRRWLVEHSDVADQRTVALLSSVDELMLIELARPLPDMSPSLTELLSIRRSGP